jgi:hypothetical protein
MDKSYVENAYQNGIFTLPIQIKPITIQEFKNTFLNTNVVAYGFSGSFPSMRTFKSANGFLLYFDNNKIVEFCSLKTMIKDSWDEYGSLKIQTHDDPSTIRQGLMPIERFEIEPFIVNSITKLVYQDEGMYIDCGIVFSENENNEILIAAGFSTDVTIRTSFSNEEFDTDTPENLFKRVPF